MSKRTINLHPELGENAVNCVQRVINEVSDGDELTINLESADAHRADPIIELLDESGFDYQAKGSHDGRSYYINARRKLH
ncbi:hypothetical protein [Desulfolucanica intricata]|uniref:hypothetical protein n=1 Tax=Desulfolucanica intricata TaxID=1285191 RepID=UPI00082CF64F|nr:hypothetical protein [Desulfolucanica intricata]